MSKSYFGRIAEVGQLIIISGPEGTGKTTIIKEYMSTHPNAVQCVRVTNKDPNPEETEGKDYYFASRTEFDRMVRSHQLLEHEYVGRNGFGTSRKTVEDARNAGHNVILKLDVVSAMMVRAHCPDATLIFFVPPTWEDLKERINKKYEGKVVDMDERLMIAQEEVLCAGQYDYVLINDTVEKSVRRLDQIVHGNRYSRQSMKGFLESYIESEISSELADEFKSL